MWVADVQVEIILSANVDSMCSVGQIIICFFTHAVGLFLLCEAVCMHMHTPIVMAI